MSFTGRIVINRILSRAQVIVNVSPINIYGNEWPSRINRNCIKQILITCTVWPRWNARRDARGEPRRVESANSFLMLVPSRGTRAPTRLRGIRRNNLSATFFGGHFHSRSSKSIFGLCNVVQGANSRPHKEQPKNSGAKSGDREHQSRWVLFVPHARYHPFNLRISYGKFF